MGFFDSLSSLLEAATPWSTVEAESKTPADNEDSEGETVVGGKATAGDDEEGENGGGEEVEEEEEEELVDPKETFEEECRESKGCAPFKHHFDECVERVTSADEGNSDKTHPNEDCVEEFFHLAHCANQCAAPKLWAVLK